MARENAGRTVEQVGLAKVSGGQEFEIESGLSGEGWRKGTVQEDGHPKAVVFRADIYAVSEIAIRIGERRDQFVCDSAVLALFELRSGSHCAGVGERRTSPLVATRWS